MEFHEKLQELRKQRGLTQEEVAEALFVSRTAVSKWESGRGYPSIDSLKAISKFFKVSIDELLSGDEVLSIAEEDRKRRDTHIRDMVYGLLDLSVAILFFLPFFGQKVNGVIQEISLLSLTEISMYLKIAYYVVVIAIILSGILTLALQNCESVFFAKNKSTISFALNILGLFLFIISLQPYVATLLFVLLVIKALMLIKFK
ncbi:MAG: helix-turn-helix transcriptional regulator [Clostridia bacterium]|nr:helix-turn-helix transcriptional regulator [Clostridia bacterium]